ncbi:MAG: 2-oxo acid dehydrogenase subunit E2 [Deltaproteobacteria bacterium]|nr:2-oxo acid dehydrogenase subunit E2 [Deltaproteobacteria bacterium]
MLVDIVMPQLGESVVEGLVSRWLVKVGDAVRKDQPLVEISTDKVDAEIPSPVAGVITAILAKEGDTVPIQTVIARIETEKEAVAPPPEPPAPKWDEETEGFPGAMARKTGPPIPSPPRVEAPPAVPPPPSTGARFRITPVVARMAAEYRLDLSKIRGTGIDGRVTKKDVEEFLARGGAPEPSAAPSAQPEVREPAPSAPPPPPAPPPRPAAPSAAPLSPGPLPSAPAPPAPPSEDRIIPFTPIRKRIAEHMVRSKQTSPHVHNIAEVDMSKVFAFRKDAKEKGVSLTFLPFVIRAACRALREVPIMNASVEGEAVRIRKDIHIGVAVDTDRGLVVPVIRHADRLSLSELAKAVEDLGERARAHRVMPDEMTGGTFSVTNPGPKGNLFGTPIINQPQVGILRLGQVQKRAVVVEKDGEDAIVIRPIMYLVLAYDHRIIDGVTGNGFLYRVREILEAGEFSL